MWPERLVLSSKQKPLPAFPSTTFLTQQGVSDALFPFVSDSTPLVLLSHVYGYPHPSLLNTVVPVVGQVKTVIVSLLHPGA